jgi:glycosyltransferase involved in cell wall biosynthesis
VTATTDGSGARRLRVLAAAAGPVFYQVPLYRELAADPRVDLTVLFASSGGARPYDAAFGGRSVVWDVDLLGGYQSRFVKAADRNEVNAGFLAMRDLDVIRPILQERWDALWVHGYSYLTLWLAIATATLRGIPVLIREEQTLLHGRPWPKRWLREAMLRGLFRNVRGLYIGTNNRRFFARYGVSQDRLHFVPYCVDNAALQQQAAHLEGRRAELRASFGIGPDAGPVVLFVGKLIPKKQPLLALEAFAKVRRDLPCALLVVGEGELEAVMRSRIARDAIPDVRFSGFLNRGEIARAFAAADLFVLPSGQHETWGLVVNEAMNFALPVVVSDKVGCAVDLVRDGDNGFVVVADQVGPLARAIGELVQREDLRRAMGRRSRERIERWHYGLAAEGVVEACQAAAGIPRAERS